jgi:threonine dehydratase
MEITKQHIEQAHERIKPFVHRTPVLRSHTLDQLSGGELFFKCENFQKIGAFKIRGALSTVLSLTPDQLANGIATHSSGNHAQAIAYAARHAGIKAYIVMPATSPKVKINAVKGYGAEITFCEPNQQARESALQKIINDTGAEFIHPYNDHRVIAGQATVAKELTEDFPGLDFLVVPVGGGGLLSGTLLSAHYFSPAVKVVAAEPEGAADAVLSLKTGQIESATFIQTIADGLLTRLGDKTFPIIRDLVKDILTVSDQEIIAAMKLVYERMKIIIEPSSAVTLALVLKHPAIFRGKRTGIIFSGGNVDVSKLGEWFS